MVTNGNCRVDLPGLVTLLMDVESRGLDANHPITNKLFSL